MIAPLVHDLEKDYLEKEIGYEAGYLDAIPTEYEDNLDEEATKELETWLDDLNKKAVF